VRCRDLGGKLAVAVAPDAWSPIASLRPDEFTVAAVSEVWSEQGYIRIDGQARPGYRLKLVVRRRVPWRVCARGQPCRGSHAVHLVRPTWPLLLPRSQ
jgi:hypothetical protein